MATKVLLGNIKGPQGETGPQGASYVLTEADKQDIANAVRETLTPDTWIFTMEDDSIVTKEVVIG